MSDNRGSPEGKTRTFVVRSYPLITRAQAEKLQRELDRLALLLNEVKRQTDKVEAAADAIGDALIGHLDTVPPFAERDSRKRAATGAKPNSRARVLRPFPEPKRSHDLEQAQG